MNLNDMVTVNLTQRGKEIVGQDIESMTAELWVIMQTFGAYLSMISESPFIDNEVTPQGTPRLTRCPTINRSEFDV